MHVFGHACSINEINKIAKEFKLKVIGMLQKHLKLSTKTRVLIHCWMQSFNGNKIITTGGGGAIITDIQVFQNSQTSGYNSKNST